MLTGTEFKKILRDLYKKTYGDNQYDLVRGLACLAKLCDILEEKGIITKEEKTKIMTIDKIGNKKKS